ncbi:MAG: hypothetical protein WAS27_00705 [Candidatus Saccharimonadales bacterium]
MSKKAERQTKILILQWLTVVLVVVVMVIVAAIVMMPKSTPDATVNIERDDPASAEVKRDNYMGLTEEVALEKARLANIPARVVERDSQPLPMRMDFREGRLNMTVQDGKVTRVDVEGQPTAE